MAESWDFEGWFNALPFVNIETLATDDRNCGICRVEYSLSSSDIGDQEDPPEKPVRLACGHVFGELCLKEWLSPAPQGGNSNSCPTCRQQLFGAWPSNDEVYIAIGTYRWPAEEFQRLETLHILEQIRQVRLEFMERFERFEQDLIMGRLWQAERGQRIQNLVDATGRRYRQEHPNDHDHWRFRMTDDDIRRQIDDERRRFEQEYREALEHPEDQNNHDHRSLRERYEDQRRRLEQEYQGARGNREPQDEPRQHRLNNDDEGRQLRNEQRREQLAYRNARERREHQQNHDRQHGGR